MTTTFDHEQFHSIYPDGIENHYWTIARNHIIYWMLVKNGLRNKKILEIGCGRGVVTKYLRGKGIQVTGVELADTSPYPGAENFVKLHTNALDLSEDERAEYEVLMMLDVVEHIEDPTAFLEEIIAAFPNVKQLVLSVPARKEIWSNYDEFNGHYRRYDLDQLKTLIESVNYKTKDISYFFHILFPVMKFVLRFNKKRETTIKAPKGFLKLFIHKILYFILLQDYLALPPGWKGSSLLVIGDKK